MSDEFKALLSSLQGRGITNIGLPWYESNDYERIKSIMKDGDSFPVTYQEWRMHAERLEEVLRGESYTPVRAHIRPVDFVQWCSAQGHNVDSHGRNAFASLAAVKGNGHVH